MKKYAILLLAFAGLLLFSGSHSAITFNCMDEAPPACDQVVSSCTGAYWEASTYNECIIRCYDSEGHIVFPAARCIAITP
jgi:hypothetical protein